MAPSMDEASARDVLGRTVRIWCPLLLNWLFYNATIVLTLALVGHTSARALVDTAAVGLGSVFTNVIGRSMVFGLCAGIDTLATQAFGRRDLLALGVLLQRALLVVRPSGCACAAAAQALPSEFPLWYSRTGNATACAPAPASQY